MKKSTADRAEAATTKRRCSVMVIHRRQRTHHTAPCISSRRQRSSAGMTAAKWSLCIVDRVVCWPAPNSRTVAFRRIEQVEQGADSSKRARVEGGPEGCPESLVRGREFCLRPGAKRGLPLSLGAGRRP